MRLQVSLAGLTHPVLIRGGIAKGTLYYEMDIIYGQGLTEAYLLESNMAKYPRIVFGGATYKAGIDVAKYMFHIKLNCMSISKDDDMLYYIDYLRGSGLDYKSKIKLFDRLLLLCKGILDKSMDMSLREKYIWLNEKIEDSISKNDLLKEAYDRKKDRTYDWMRDLKVVQEKIREQKNSKEE